MSKLNDIWNSFKINDSGASSRKLSAFWAIVVVSSYITYQYTTSAIVFEMVIVWLTFACVCLGLVTIPELLKDLSELKNGSKKATDNSEA
jgi:hypothetical protein